MTWRYELLIGPNRNALPFPAALRDDTRYIAIDPAYGENFHPRINKEMQRTYGIPDDRLKRYPFEELSERGVVFLGQSATDTHLPDASMDVIRMVDVLNMPISWYPDPQCFVVDLWGRGLFREMARVLSPDGRIVIGAKCTPEFCPPQRIDALARINGLEMRVLLDAAHRDATMWGAETYTPMVDDWEDALSRSYLVELRRKDGNGPRTIERNL